jgi:hypothetical protein
MTNRDVFEIIVRTVGLMITLAAAWLILLGLFGLISASGQVTGLLFYGIPALFVGLWLLRGARSIVSFAFSKDQSEDR